MNQKLISNQMTIVKISKKPFIVLRTQPSFLSARDSAWEICYTETIIINWEGICCVKTWLVSSLITRNSDFFDFDYWNPYIEPSYRFNLRCLKFVNQARINTGRNIQKKKSPYVFNCFDFFFRNRTIFLFSYDMNDENAYFLV